MSLFSKCFVISLILLITQQICGQWQKVNFSYHPANHFTTFIKYKNTIYVGDYLKGVLYSEDNCNTWKSLNYGLKDYYNTFTINNFYSDTSGLYVLSYDGIYKFDEDAKYWRLFSKTPAILSIARSGDVFIGGVSGNGIYISTDGGLTWAWDYHTAGVIKNAASVITLNNKFIVSGDSGVFYTTDNGSSWNNVLSNDTRQLLLKNDTLYAATTKGIKYTVNEGISWVDIGPQNIYAINLEVFNGKYFAGGDMAIKYYTKELSDWVPACRNSPDGFSHQVRFLKIIDDTLYSCNFGELYRRALDDFNYPELSVPDDILTDYYNGEVGNEVNITFAIGNNGFDTLKVFDVISSNPDFEISRSRMDIPPEWGYGVYLTYKFTRPGAQSTEITVISNDTYAKNSFKIDITGIPIEFELKQNYPNPFNPETKIEFTIPTKAHTSLKVYNSIGQLVKSLLDDEVDGGKYSYSFNAVDLTAGAYFYQLITGSIIQTKKMILLK